MFKLFFFLLYVALIATLVFWLGPFCVNFVFAHTIHHTLPYIWALLVSFFTGELTVPAAIIVKVLLIFGYLT